MQLGIFVASPKRRSVSIPNRDLITLQPAIGEGGNLCYLVSIPNRDLITLQPKIIFLASSASNAQVSIPNRDLITLQQTNDCLSFPIVKFQSLIGI